MTFKDLKHAATAAVDAKKVTADALSAATEADSRAAEEVTSTQTRYAQAVMSAPGHTVVYAGPPVEIDQSTDGLTVTSLVVASGDDAAPGDQPEPTGDQPSPSGDQPAPTGDQPAPTGDGTNPTPDEPGPAGDQPVPTA